MRWKRIEMELSIWAFYGLCALALAYVASEFFVVFAQGPTPVDPTTTPTEWYTSVAGVAAATIFGTSVLKRLLGNVEYLKEIPTWLYAVVVSVVLTTLCARVFGTLPGSYWQLALTGAQNAAIASGVYEWTFNSTKTLRQSATSAGVRREHRRAKKRST